MTDIVYRPAEADDGARINALFRKVFDKDRSLALWRWLYRDTPWGAGPAVVAESGGEFVGHAGLVRRPMRLGDRDVHCGQSIDAMTHPDWQRRGINKALHTTLGTLLADHDIGVVYGFSNENSTPGILKYQGRVALGTLPLLVRWLGARSLLKARGALPDPRPAIIPADYALDDSALDDRSGAGSIRVPATRAYLQWRYSKPGGIYREVAIRKGGELQGFGVLSIRKQAGLRAAFISDVVAADGRPAVAREVIDGLVNEARASGCGVITALAYPGAANRPMLTAARFLPIPGVMQPEDVTFSVRAENPSDAALVNRAANWQISWGLHDLT